MLTSGPTSRHPNGHGNGNGGNGHGNGNGNGNGNGHGNGNGSGTEFAGRRPPANEQILEILHVIFKRKRLIVALFLVVVLPGLLATLIARESYIATAKVMVASDRADITIQPTDVNSLTTVKLNESTVNSEVHVIQSRELVEQVVRGLRLAQASGGVIGIANAAGDDDAIGQQVNRELKKLRVTPIRSSNVIKIEYQAVDPVKAAQVVNRVVDEYLAYHAVVHGHKGLTSFYEDQSRLLRANLKQAEDAMREFALREGLVAPTAEIQSTVSAVADMEGALRESTATIAGAEERVRAIREQLTQQPAVVKRAQNLEVNPVVRQLSQNVIDKEVERVGLLRKYTEQDRRVRDNGEVIAELQSRLNEVKRDEPTIVAGEVYRPNPVYDAGLSELLKLEANLRETRARRLTLDQELARTRRRLVGLKEKALDFDRLEQEVMLQRTNLDLYEKRQQEARISEAMDQEKLVNVEVVQRPALPLDPADEKKVPLTLAVLSGLAVAFGGAFGIEYLNRTLRFERDVERHLGLPVLGTVAEVGKT